MPTNVKELCQKAASKPGITRQSEETSHTKDSP